jgi:hypothetical protein
MNEGFLINENYDNLGFEELTPLMIIECVKEYEKSERRLYKADGENENEFGVRILPAVDKRSINVSDKINAFIARKSGFQLNRKYPDLIKGNRGFETKATWLWAGQTLPKWFMKEHNLVGDAKEILSHHKNNYGYGVPFDYWMLPPKAPLKWSSHYQNKCSLLAFAWDFTKDGNMAIIGVWFAELSKNDWTEPNEIDIESRNTPVVATTASANQKLSCNWIAINVLYYDLLRKNNFINDCKQELVA